MSDLKRLDNEVEEKYIWRVGQLIESGKYDGWKEITPIINEQWREDETKYRDESAYRKKYQAGKLMYDNVFSKMIGDEYSKEILKNKIELQKERVKLSTEKLEINRWIRESAREEMFWEQLIAEVRSSETNAIPIKKIDIIHNKRAGILDFADQHFGKDYKIYGLRDEIINEYSPEIFYDRMEHLYNETLDIIKKEGFTSIDIFSLGDTLDGFIRNSQLWTLRYGVTKSSIIYGKYIAEWLKKLSKEVVIRYHQTAGNHTELRLLDGKKGEHANENIEEVVLTIIETKNEDNPNFSIVENKTGLIFAEIAGYNHLGIHGEVKDLSQAIKDFSDIYDIKIDFIHAGHKHHSTFVNCGYRKGAIGVGSVVGSDDFSMKIKKHADASASFIIFEEGKGKVLDYTIVLN
jgi:hypothetical protein